MQNSNQRLMRWCLFLQPYALEMRLIKGRDNVLADARAVFRGGVISLFGLTSAPEWICGMGGGGKARDGSVESPKDVEEEGSAKEEIWCLKRVGKTSDWLRLVENMEVTLGRALNVTYQLLSLSCPLMISRQHCLFKQNDDGQWTVTDKKSLNGVWVNGERIAAEKAWPLSAGDSVRLGVPVEGTQMEFEYELVQDRLEAVEPFLRGAQPGVEDTVPPRAKQTKRRLEAEESDPAKLYRAKLYRCSAVDKSLGRPCPAGELPPPAAQSQAREAPGPSVAVARPEGRRPAPHAKPSAARVLRRSDSPQTLRDSPRQQQQQQQQHAGDEEVPSAEEPSAQPAIAQAELRSQQPGRLEEIRELQAQQSVLQARLRTQEEQQLEDVLHQEEMRMEVEKRQLQEVHLKKQLEDALQEQRKVIEELKCSRQGFEEILQAKDKELEMSKEEKEQARAQKEEVVIQMTDVLENELQCIICSELLIEAVTLSCAHSFCQYCIGAWRRRSAACPICRQDILSQARSLVLDNCIDRMVESLSTELKERRQALIAERKAAVAAVSAVAVVLISDDDTSYSSSSSTLGEDSTISESGSIAISESDMSDFGSSDSGSLAALDSSLDTSGYDDI
ncbi:hypothetical protein AAFF_G00088770 [Aldrovandia affinis]|uniref:E3 ubiquitin-protein ligase CHFR n=1 Tax=Aldrovandia affinis TaxID=143900 RepID=A0AAD7RWJ7_9TELE|nr:hypothetical protein AAFF_G00088770 [Aldrovandia affinis]